MSVHALLLAATLAIPGTLSDGGPANLDTKGEVFIAEPPVPFPDQARVLRALPPLRRARSNVRITCELVSWRADPPRIFPLVGRASLSRAWFRCTVRSDRGREVVHIEVGHLRPDK